MSELQTKTGKNYLLYFGTMERVAGSLEFKQTPPAERGKVSHSHFKELFLTVPDPDSDIIALRLFKVEGSDNFHLTLVPKDSEAFLKKVAAIKPEAQLDTFGMARVPCQSEHGQLIIRNARSMGFEVEPDMTQYLSPESKLALQMGGSVPVDTTPYLEPGINFDAADIPLLKRHHLLTEHAALSDLFIDILEKTAHNQALNLQEIDQKLSFYGQALQSRSNQKKAP